MMRTSLVASARGSVMVLTAVALIPLLLFTAFAIDVSHWWAYSRNLQNRADAAAFAGGTAFMGTGFAAMCSGVTSGDGTLAYASPQRNAGDFAQLFSGPGNNQPWPVVPYGTGAPEPDQIPAPGDQKVFNETSSSSQTYSSYINIPNLTAASLSNYYVLLNAKNYFNKLTATELTEVAGGPDFGMGNFCNSDPHLDQTDLDPGKPGPMVDVKVTQKNVPLFFPLIGVQPNISAHARVSLNQEQTGAAKAIAVKNPADTNCVRVTLTDDNTGSVLGSWMQNTPLAATKGKPIEFDVSAPSVTFGGTGADAVSATVFLGDGSDNCNATGNGVGDLYDGYSFNKNTDPSLGLVRINEYDPNATGAHLASVTLSNAGCTDPGDTSNQNPYFFYFWASSSCSVTLNANVSGIPNGNIVCAQDLDTGTTKQMVGSGSYTATFQIGSFTGHHSFLVGYRNNNCNGQPTWFNGGNPVQQTYAGFDDDNGQTSGQSTITQEDDSGPIAGIAIQDTNTPANVVDSVAEGSTKSLLIKVFVQGLKYYSPSAPAVVLRTSAQGSSQTGVVDCGEGNGNGNPLGSGVLSAIIGSCPKLLTQNTRGTCNPPPTSTTSPWDCVQTIPGDRSKLPAAIAQVVNPTLTHNGCSANNWPAYATDQKANPISPKDPRVMTFIITGAFALDGNAQPQWIPVLLLADFYVTGWDTTLPNKYQCDNNEPYPLPASGPGNGQNNPTNAAFWGHWFQDVTLGAGGPNACVVDSFGNCVLVLSR
jgi:Putative Flp pilus-assembly TadE/G-like